MKYTLQEIQQAAAQMNMKLVPKERIKTLAVRKLEEYNTPEKFVEDVIERQLGYELAHKLIEFRKYKIIKHIESSKYGPGILEYEAILEVIVPE